MTATEIAAWARAQAHHRVTLPGRAARPAGPDRYEEGLRPGRAGRAAGAGECANRRGTFAAAAGALGLHSVTGAPIIVDGAVWGLVTIASADGPIPDHARDRLAGFTELLGTAMANTQSRAELSGSRARIVAAADQTRRF